MRISFLFIIVLFASRVISAQVTFSENIPEDTLQSNILQNLQVNRDPRLDKMLNWHIVKNEKMNGIEGFRVEIFFSSEMNALEQAKNKKVEFLSEYPENTVNIKYDAPNFKVRVGDFRTKNEALKLLKMIEKNYPMAFIVPDKINFPLLKTTKL
ncbi:MAG: SPOR domain-containing protein [Draconibacterium sp.]|nr:SPOR domain-containing protein [Draconibacterium sp.]